MEWTVTIHEQTSGTLKCTVTHENKKLKAGDVQQAIYDPSHPDLTGWVPPSNYVQGDAIVLLNLDVDNDPNATPSTSTRFDLGRDHSTDKEFVVAVPFDNTSSAQVKVKGKGTRTASKVSDELGGV